MIYEIEQNELSFIENLNPKEFEKDWAIQEHDKEEGASIFFNEEKKSCSKFA